MTDIERSLIAEADALISRFGPCQIDDGSCRALSDVRECCYRSIFRKDPPTDLWCPYLGPSGCEHLNLKCKTWFCRTAIAAMPPECLEAFKDLEQRGKELGLVGRPFLGQKYVDHHRY